MALEVTHNDDQRFILNSCSLRAIDFHQETAGFSSDRVEPLQWLDALHEGLGKWKANKKKGKLLSPPGLQSFNPKSIRHS
jgi:hypothetical protein